MQFSENLKARLQNSIQRLCACIAANPAVFWRACLFWSFWLSLAFFPIGYGFREVMPPVCAIFLCLYYRYAWTSSTLHQLGCLASLFLCAAIMTVIGVVFSIHPINSLLHAGMGVNKAYILPFIAMEAAHTRKDLTRLCWACVFACFWQGLDGLWQAFTGFDFVMGYPSKGRLTGSLGDYTVGNYMALAMIPAFGCWHLLRRRASPYLAAFIMFALLWPGVFILIGASSRSAVLAVAVALGLWGIARFGLRNPAWLALPAAAALCFIIFEGYRFLPENIIGDNRWDLWRLAWRVFMEHPWFGAGAGQYNAAFHALGLAPVREVPTISHPHDLYLDILYAHGIIGFALGMIFFMGFAIWGYCRLAPHIRKASGGMGETRWILAAWFWLGYIGWLVNGIFGHDLYRIWWLALAMSNMGIMIGGIVQAQGTKNAQVSRNGLKY